MITWQPVIVPVRAEGRKLHRIRQSFSFGLYLILGARDDNDNLMYRKGMMVQ